MELVKKYILKQVADNVLSQVQAKKILLELRNKNTSEDDDIAVIGMSCKFPLAKNINEFWNNIKNGRECISNFPTNRLNDIKTDSSSNEKRKKYKGGFLDEIDKFDASFFNITPREAKFMDPIQRIFLETAWEAIQDSGYSEDKVYGTRTGVFVGYDHTSSSQYRLTTEKDQMHLTGSWSGILASRLSYILNLIGPSIVVDTACSSGLTAVHLACQAIKRKECNQVIAGGICILIDPILEGQNISMDILEGKDGRIRPFDKGADGTTWGEGVGVVVLKPLRKAIEDNDNIHCVIKGSAINNDGSSNGITAPNAKAQEDVIVQAWENANIDPLSISYIETHGTGTILGDPIEIKGLSNAFRRFTNKNQFCAIGSIKANIGHTVAASGMASLIKVILSIKHGVMPPTINFNQPNPYINFSTSPVYINDKLRKWENDNYPRRAGISSFGFSGTNCHIVVEEANIEKVENLSFKEMPNILTISSKDDNSLKNLVKSYISFLINNKNINLNNLCYTANVGRKHYSHRIAIVFNNIYELIKRLVAVDNNYLDRANSKYICVGNNERLKQNKQINDNFYLNKLDEVTKLPIIIDNEGLANSVVIENRLFKMCNLYVRGANFEWSKLYDKKYSRRISIPVYQFNRTRYWAKSKNIKNSNSQYKSGENINKPLINRHLASSIDRETFSTFYNVKNNWVLSEHEINGKYILPGTSLIEMICEASRTFIGNSIELKNLLFLRPIVVEGDETIEVQTIFDKKDKLEFRIISRIINMSNNKSSKWIVNMEGDISKYVSQNKNTIDVHNLVHQDKWEKYYLDLNKFKFLKFGPRWFNIEKVLVNNNNVLVKLQLPSQFKNEVNNYVLYPALLDNAVNIISQGLELHLPFKYNSIKIYKSLPECIYSYVRKNDIKTVNSEFNSFDATLMDKEGNVLVEVKDYLVKKVRLGEDTFKDKNSLKYYKTQWVEKEVFEKAPKCNGITVVFTDGNYVQKKLLNRIRNWNNNIIEVEIGKAYTEESENKYTVSDNEKDYQRLFREIKGKELTGIIHLTSVGDKTIKNIEDLRNNENKGLYSLLYIVKSIILNKIDKKIDLLIVSHDANKITGKESEINPDNSAVIGLGKVIDQEYDLIRCRNIDIDTYEDTEKIISELMSKENVYQTAYRDGKRYIEELVEVDMDSKDNEKVKIKEEGTYIIAGGMGGIGTEIAKYLSTKNKVNLIFINRTKFPERKKWDEFLQSNESIKLKSKIKVIKEIEKNGSTVDIYSGDISNIERMDTILKEVRKRHGKINGVIHSAGIAGDGMLFKKDKEVFNKVVKPKIEGTWILNKLTENDRLDFFVMFSSIASFIGGVGQGDYAAANSYLDSFAEYRAQTGKKTLTINWPAWKETGMAVEYGVNNDNGIFKAISTSNAIKCFERAIKSSSNRVIIADFNYSSIDNKFLMPITYNSINEKVLNIKLRKNANQTAVIEKIKLVGNDNYYTETERKVAEIWGEILGLNEVNVYDNFYELGGDSIQAIKITNRTKQRFGIDIGMDDVFKYLTIKDFSNFVDSQNKTTNNNQMNSKISKNKYKEYKLSHSQERLWILQKMNPSLIAYNLPVKYFINLEVNPVLLEKCLNELICRHSSFRTIFKDEDGKPKQVILDNLNINMKFIDLSIKQNRYSIFDNIISEDKLIPFDLSKQLLRATLFKLETNKYCFYINIHHIIIDGWSIDILLKELAIIYEARVKGKEPILKPIRLNYIDFINMQDKLEKTEEFKKYEKFWLTELGGELPYLNLPLDFKRGNVRTYNGSFLKFTFDKGNTIKLNKIAKKLRITMNMFLLSAYSVLLHKLTLDNDIIIGIPISGRENKELENVIGFFINNLCLRLKFDDLLTFREFSTYVKNKSLKIYKNRKYSFDLLVSKINPNRNESSNPIFTTMFQYYDIIPQENEGISQFDFDCQCTQVNEQLEIRFEYNTDLFKKETVSKFLNYFLNILNDVTGNLDIKLKDIELCSEKELKKILVEFNDTKVKYNDNITIHEMFEKQVKKTPNKIAVQCAEKKITYQELNEKSNQLAVLLLNKGVKNEDIIGIAVGQSIELIIGILAILKAGAAYLPIDTSYPIERINFMLKDSNIKIIFTDSKNYNKFELVQEKIKLDDSKLYKGEKKNLDVINSSLNLAYIIYTSGSSGTPKGVQVEHRSMINYISWRIRNYQFNPQDVTLQVLSQAFDGFASNLYSSLFTGGCLILVGDEHRKDVNYIKNLIINEKVTNMSIVPSIYNALCKISDNAELSSLKFVVLAGEKTSKRLIELSKSKSADTILFNEYGPTENCVTTTALKGISVKNTSLIGKPISNNRVYILDNNKKIRPIGLYGELCVSGDSLARGYINMNLTNLKFIDNPFEKGNKMYCTGDIARWLPDGNLELSGRIDEQVKILGNRIELGEVENQLTSNKKIKEAVVIVVKDGKSEFLCAYIVKNSEINDKEIKQFLSEKLPTYMIPTYFIGIDEIPKLANGKINKNVLPKIDIRSLTSYKGASNKTEQKIAKIWENVLEIKDIGINDDFFKLGGDSLKAIFAITKTNKALDIQLPLNILFNKSTVKEIAEYVSNIRANNYKPIVKISEKPYYELSSSQKRIYVLNRLDEKSITYNMPFATTIEGNLDIDKLELSFEKLIERHESLRTAFILVDGLPKQKINKNVDFKLQMVYCNEDEINRVMKKFIKPFNLKNAPLLRAMLICISKEKYILLIDMHHIISDGGSIKIITDEISKLYNGQKLSPLKVQYKDYVEWQKIYLKSDIIKKQEKYWNEMFSEDIPLLNMPLDYTRPAQQSFVGKSIEFSIEKELVDKLKYIANVNNATLYMVLLAAYNILLFRYTDNEDIIVGSPISGRNHADLEGIVGIFINTLALRNRISKNMTFEEVLKGVRERCIEAFDNQDFQFDMLIDKLDLEKDLSRGALFDTMFILNNLSVNTFNLNGVKTYPFKVHSIVSKFDFVLNAFENACGEVEFSLEYCIKLFNASTMKNFAQRYKILLKQIVSNPKIMASKFDLLLNDEKKTILMNFSSAKISYNKTKTIYRLFEERVAKNPNKVAITYGTVELTYEELNSKANSLARELRKKDECIDNVIGLIVEPSIEMIVGILAILKAGGAYLPVDPNMPRSRINLMLNNSNAVIVLSKKRFIEKFNFNGRIIDLEDKDNYLENHSNLGNTSKSNDLAYVIYTSGSTGIPKGVMIEHRNVVNFILGITRCISFTTEKSILVLTTVSFDIFALETLIPLINGLSVVIASEKQKMTPEGIIDTIMRKNIQMIQLTPSRAKLLLNRKELLLKAKSLTDIMIGGEQFSEKLLGELKSVTKAKIYNLYGPTEATIWCTIKCLNDQENVTIGKALANSRIYILDKYGMPQIPGVPGELCIAGDGLARGYINNPKQTNEKFIYALFNSKERIYKTGDLAKMLTNGEFKFIRRMDYQVKIRGYRIEIGEIENHLSLIDAIKENLVVDFEDEDSNKYLCAYIVLKKDRIISLDQIKDTLNLKLPQYMIPSFFIILNSLPLNINGKVDRNNLPKPKEFISKKFNYEAPRNKLEKRICDIWKEVLGIKDIGIRESFFDIGGNSLLAVKLEVKMEENGLKIDFSDIYRYKSIEQIANFLGKNYRCKAVINKNTMKSNFIAQSNLQLENGKSIRNIEPFNDIFFESCFYNSLFPIIRHFNRTELAFIVNDIAAYDFNLYEKKPMIKLKHFVKYTFEELLNKEGMNCITKKKSNDIIQDIINALNKERPVVIWIDCYYELLRKDVYQKQHLPHTWAIYGFNEAMQIFYIMEHDNKENLSYKKREISFKEVINCYSGFIDNYCEDTNRITYYEFFLKNNCINSSVKSNKDYAERLYYNYKINRTNVQYGLRSLKQFCNWLKTIIVDEFKLKGEAESIINALNQIINWKKVDKYRVLKLMNDNEIIANTEEILNSWILIRTILAKYVFSKSYNRDSMKLIDNKLILLSQLEQKNNKCLYKRIDNV